jgi:hypothetical protein
MGSRGNIRITQPWSPESIYLYTHSGGHNICESLAQGIVIAEWSGRTQDPSYATRIIFDELTKCSRTQTGYAISIGRPDDNEYPMPEVSWDDNWVMTIAYESVNYTPQAFIAKYLVMASVSETV